MSIDNANITGTIYGGNSKKDGNSDNNTVIISNSTTKIVNGGNSSNGNSNNKVIISNSTINGMIVGGWSVNGNQVNENVIALLGNATVTGFIRGGWSKSASSGNQLIIGGKGNSTNRLLDFQEYFFALPTDINNGKTMLTLIKQLTFNDTDKIRVGAMGELTNLKKGDKVTLIDGVSVDSFKADMYNKNLVVKHEDTKKLIDSFYEFDLEQVDNKLNATLLNEKEKKQSNEKAKALSEGTAGVAAAVVEAGSVMADKAINQAVNQVNNNANVGNSKVIDNFGVIGVGSNRYQTGSYVDSKSINISVGVALVKK